MEKRAENKTFREGFIALLNAPLRDKEGKPTGKTTRDAVLAGVVKKAVAGDIQAASFIRDTIGEKPIEKVANVTPEREVVDGVEKALFGQ